MKLVRSNVKIGTFVKRGRDWSWGNQDEGSVTGVITLNFNGSSKWVGVAWLNENGDVLSAYNYSVGEDGMLDLYVNEESPFKIFYLKRHKKKPIVLMLKKNNVFVIEENFSFTKRQLKAFLEGKLLKVHSYSITKQTRHLVKIGCNSDISIKSLKELLIILNTEKR